MRFYVLASGSKGNATIIQSNDGRLIQIDMGISLRAWKEKINALSFNIEDIEALLLTHEHSDHIKGAWCFNKNIIYCAKGTFDVEKNNVLELYEKYNIAGFDITVLATSHDAKNPIGFIIESDNEKMVYMTDTGYISERNLKYMSNPDYICIESNHNVKMLFETQRPAQLIMRIIGDEGHLSNEDSAMYMSEVIGDKTKELILMHLSEEANSPEVALATYKKVFLEKHINMDNIKIYPANQRIMVMGGDKIKV